MKLLNGKVWKKLISKDYNYVFNKETGFFARWGETKEADPEKAPFPEILDLEISSGECSGDCKFCSPAGTLVDTPTGNQNIEKLFSGDSVLSYDLKTNKNVSNKIVETYCHNFIGKLICIELNNGQILKLTPDHTVILKDGSEIMASKLTAASEIISINMKIKRIYTENFEGKVYNFHCMPNENYFSEGVLVHNCYKDNGVNRESINMSFEQFKIIIDKMPWLTQIAFGICDVDSNKDMIKMMEYAKIKSIIPNFTCNGNKVTTEFANKISKICGAVAVSIVNKENSYNAIKKFTDAGMSQVNVHYMLSQETYDRAFKIIDDMVSDSRLAKMNAIVFLQYKHKNLKSPFHSMVDVNKYRQLVDYATKKGVNYGFDSCSANIYLESVKGLPNFKQLEMAAEPCESFGLFSSYINCKGEWKEGINVLECKDFVKEVWNSDLLLKYQKISLQNNRKCPFYDIN